MSPSPEQAGHRDRARKPWAGTGAVTEPNLARAASGARILLEALGIELDNESLARTPERMAASFAELMSQRPFQMTTFPTTAATTS
jgi:GTP cyclohydrolase I